MENIYNKYFSISCYTLAHVLKWHHTETFSVHAKHYCEEL
jgi:hypothetical protein